MIEQQSLRILILSTHTGHLKVHRLLYDTASVPSIFQRRMTNILGNISELFVSLDNILVCRKSEQEFYERLLQVLKRFLYHGIGVKQYVSY
jgi:hypothetical protein